MLRNYGAQSGKLYKPDSMNIGDGKDFGDFNADDMDFGNMTRQIHREMPIRQIPPLQARHPIPLTHLRTVIRAVKPRQSLQPIPGNARRWISILQAARAASP